MNSVPAIPTRLCWDGKTTFMRHSGVEVHLPFRPPIFGPQITEINYTPTQGRRELRESAHGWRDMAPEESDTLHAWMALLSADVLAAANRLVGA